MTDDHADGRGHEHAPTDAAVNATEDAAELGALRVLERHTPAGGWRPADVVRATVRRRRRNRAISASVLVIALALTGVVIARPTSAHRPIAYPSRVFGDGGSHVASRLDGAVQLVADQSPAPLRDAAATEAVTRAEQQLTLDLLNRVGTSRNESVSALSLALVLAMLRNGARGQTAGQIASVLHSSQLSDVQQDAGLAALTSELQSAAKAAGITLQSANSLWQQRGFAIEPAFLQTLGTYFHDGVWQADFARHTAQAVKAINAWTSENTHGKITKLFDYLDPSTVLVLANALYFHANWQVPFNPQDTMPMTFTTADGTSVTAKFMSGTVYPIASTRDYEAAQLPYAGGRFAALVVMPRSGSLAQFTSELTPAKIASIAAATNNGGEVDLPRFTTTSKTDLVPILESLGMTDAFGNADLTGINAQQPLVVGQVLQRAYVSVGEKGTTAAAVTGTSVMATSGGATPLLRVTFDHPFLFLVRDTKTGAILFATAVQNPTTG